MKSLFQNANNILLLSVKPKYSSLILNKTKQVELRKVKPRVSQGDIVLLYESSPTMALMGYAVVKGVDFGNPTSLWRRVRHSAGIERKEFNLYFDGASIAFAIEFSSIIKLNQPIPLKKLRSIIDRFHPPQSYRYLSADTAFDLCTVNIHRQNEKQLRHPSLLNN